MAIHRLRYLNSESKICGKNHCIYIMRFIKEIKTYHLCLFFSCLISLLSFVQVDRVDLLNLEQ